MNTQTRAEIMEKFRNEAKAGADILVICHGGPIAEPEDAAYIIKDIRL